MMAIEPIQAPVKPRVVSPKSATLVQLGLRDCSLAGARFTGANLTGCDLEYVELSHADFERAQLTHAILTGSIMPGASFREALLSFAGLAEIQWEGADLRDANLRGCTFHMGSSRSGLLTSPIACEGSRTGFYTDDYEEQHYKAPEEIRKANLRGADLRGANVVDTDFYLVDLRDARYDPDQRQHFLRCGAILFDRM